jgi:hypothetical protein
VQSPNKFVLVMGTGWASTLKRRAARMIGVTLAEGGFGLVTGDSTGVDRWVADAFCSEQKMNGAPLGGAFVQVALKGLRFFRRGGMPLPGFAAPVECRVHVRTVEDWKREALARSHAAVMVGGGRGALDIARRAIERGRPVFPLPFLGGLTGNSDYVFQEILKTWESHPVPGLSRSQFLRLAEPWTSGTGALANLLRGTLAEVPDVFISYRRSDSSAAAGRLANDLAEHFGHRRVFFDINDIAPSRTWELTLEDALRSCKAGVVVIGQRWLASDPLNGKVRLFADDDPVRREVASLMAAGKAVFPVLVESALLPEAADLPQNLQAMLRLQATSIDNAGWDGTVARLAREIEGVIQRAEPASSAASIETSSRRS